MRNCVSPLGFKGQVPDLSLFLCAEAFVKDVKLGTPAFISVLNDSVPELVGSKETAASDAGKQAASGADCYGETG